MGLFDAIGSGLKGLFGDDFADRAATALAIGEGDYGAIASMRARKAQAEKLREEAALARETRQRAFTAFKSMGMSDEQAITLANDPDSAAAFMADRLKGQQYGSSGGSFFDPITNQTRMAPSRHEFQGSVFDVGGGAPGQKAPVTAQHEGTQWITPQPGTTAFGVNSFSGLPRNAPGVIDERGAVPSEAPTQGANSTLREQAIDAIRRGADPVKVLERLKLLEGGQSGAPTGGFL